MPNVTISEELYNKLREAVRKGACCRVDNYVQRALEASLKKRSLIFRSSRKNSSIACSSHFSALNSILKLTKA